MNVVVAQVQDSGVQLIGFSGTCAPDPILETPELSRRPIAPSASGQQDTVNFLYQSQREGKPFPDPAKTMFHNRGIIESALSVHDRSEAQLPAMISPWPSCYRPSARAWFFFRRCFLATYTRWQRRKLHPCSIRDFHAGGSFPVAPHASPATATAESIGMRTTLRGFCAANHAPTLGPVIPPTNATAMIAPKTVPVSRGK